MICVSTLLLINLVDNQMLLRRVSFCKRLELCFFDLYLYLYFLFVVKYSSFGVFYC